MRCTACNVALSDRESVRKDSETGVYYDLCGDCFQSYKTNLSTIQDTFTVDKSNVGTIVDGIQINKEVFNV